MTAVGSNAERIDAWNSSHLPVYDPGTDQIIKKCREIYFSENRRLDYRKIYHSMVNEASFFSMDVSCCRS
jgi:hypothetical protein